MTSTEHRVPVGLEGYKKAFPNALRGLEGQRLRAVVEAVHSSVLEGWNPTEQDVAAIVNSHGRGRMSPERARAIHNRVRERHLG
ncbi:hypothetical protein [Corynebacterium falsenii]